jgi:hypothetical protein
MMVTPVTMRLAVPKLSTVANCGWLVVPTGWAVGIPNTINVGTTLAEFDGAGLAMAESEYDSGLPAPLSVMTMEPVRVPEVVGLNVTETKHVPFTASVPPQVVVSLKSPVAVTLEIETGELVALLTVTV